MAYDEDLKKKGAAISGPLSGPGGGGGGRTYVAPRVTSQSQSSNPVNKQALMDLITAKSEFQPRSGLTKGQNAQLARDYAIRREREVRQAAAGLMGQRLQNEGSTNSARINNAGALQRTRITDATNRSQIQAGLETTKMQQAGQTQRMRMAGQQALDLADRRGEWQSNIADADRNAQALAQREKLKFDVYRETGDAQTANRVGERFGETDYSGASAPKGNWIYQKTGVDGEDRPVYKRINRDTGEVHPDDLSDEERELEELYQ